MATENDAQILAAETPIGNFASLQILVNGKCLEHRTLTFRESVGNPIPASDLFGTVTGKRVKQT
jgi:hypothetical protein